MMPAATTSHVHVDSPVLPKMRNYAEPEHDPLRVYGNRSSSSDRLNLADDPQFENVSTLMTVANLHHLSEGAIDATPARSFARLRKTGAAHWEAASHYARCPREQQANYTAAQKRFPTSAPAAQRLVKLYRAAAQTALPVPQSPSAERSATPPPVRVFRSAFASLPESDRAVLAKPVNISLHKFNWPQ